MIVVGDLPQGYYRAVLIDGRTFDFGAMTSTPLAGFVKLSSHKNDPNKSKYYAFTTPAATPARYHTDMYHPGNGNFIMLPAEHIESVETGVLI